MSEEIIIDEVDVAGCEYFKINRGFNCYKGYNCTDKECANCYYKQLKRLQQENEELKNRLKILDDEEFVYEVTEIEYNNFKKMNEYKQALEEIREIINEQKPPLDKAVSQSEFTLERLCVYEEKYIKVVDKINEVLNDRD